MNIYKVTLTATFSAEVWVKAPDESSAEGHALEAFGPVLESGAIHRTYLTENGGSIGDYYCDSHPTETTVERVVLESETDEDEDDDSE